MADDEAGIGQDTRLAVVLARIREHGHVLDLNTAAIEGIQADILDLVRSLGRGEEGRRGEQQGTTGEAQQAGTGGF
jgi:hypothetical protein